MQDGIPTPLACSSEAAGNKNFSSKTLVIFLGIK